MTTYYAEQSKSYWPVVDAKAAGSVKAVRGVFALTAALALNDVINMLSMPAQHVPVDCILDCDDLDSGGSPSITLSVGTATTPALLISASAVGQAGGIARMDKATGPRLAASNSDTLIQIKVAAGPATGATTGTIGLTLLYRPVQANE